MLKKWEFRSSSINIFYSFVRLNRINGNLLNLLVLGLEQHSRFVSELQAAQDALRSLT